MAKLISGDVPSQAADDLWARLTLANVYTVRFEAERHLGDHADSFRVEISPSFIVQIDRVSYLYQANCQSLTERDEVVADISVGMVATFDADEGVDVTAYDRGDVEAFGSSVALFAVYPYLREAIQACGNRLAIPNVTLDLIKQGQPLPAGLSFVDPSSDSATYADEE